MLDIDSNNEEFQFGDIVIAKRYNNSHDKMKINLGHRVGPFIIIDKVDDKYIGIYGTTKNVYNKDHEILEVNTIFRKTYFVLDFIRNISRENIGGKIETLDERQKEILKLKLKRETLIEQELTVGDIISFKNELYYVKSINPILLIRVNKNVLHRNNLFKGLNNTYQFDFDSAVIYNMLDDFKIIDYLDNKQIEYIDKYMCLSNELIKIKQPITRGMLIEYVGRLYYVYGTEKENALMYEIVEYTNNDDIELESTITINNRKYKALFKNNYEIDVNSLYILKDISQNNEIENNRITKKSYLKKNSENKKLTYSDYIAPSTVVCDRSAARVKYLVLYREDKKLILFPLEEIEKENYRAVTIRDIKSVNLCDRYNEADYYFILSKVSQYNNWILNPSPKKEIEEKKYKKIK